MITPNNFSRQWEDTQEDAVAAFIATGNSAWYILGDEVQQFEQALAAYWNIPKAVGVASGLDAIEISLRALGCKTGDKVLTTPVSAFATTLAILKIGAVPVFSDVDRSGLLDLDAAQEALSHDPAIRYFVPVHLYGHALDMRRLAAIQQRFEIAIVEDCAQSIGACSYGVPTGTVGQVAATSFYPTKNLGAMGDGGAILTRDDQCFDSVRMLRNYGQAEKYQHHVVGYNSRLDELQAALLRRVYLPRLGRWIARRRDIAARCVDEIRNGAVNVPQQPPGSQSSWHLFPVVVAPDRKGAFMAHLKRHMIIAAEHYPIAIPDQVALRQYRYEVAAIGLEQSRLFCRSQVSLPIHPYLTDAEVSTVIDAVNAWPG